MKIKQIKKNIEEALKMCDLNNSCIDNKNLTKEQIQNYLDYNVKLALVEALKLLNGG